MEKKSAVPGVEEGEQKVEPDFSTYVELLRAHNILPSMFVCMLGAWVGTHDLKHTLLNPTVLLVGRSTAPPSCAGLILLKRRTPSSLHLMSHPMQR